MVLLIAFGVALVIYVGGFCNCLLCIIVCWVIMQTGGGVLGLFAW